jgi:hypothetical protein
MPAKLSPDFSCGSRPGSHHTFAHEKSGLADFELFRAEALIPLATPRADLTRAEADCMVWRRGPDNCQDLRSDPKGALA